MKALFAALLLLLSLTACGGDDPDAVLVEALESMVGRSFKEVSKDLGLRHRNILEKAPGDYRGLSAQNKLGETVHLFASFRDTEKSYTRHMLRPKDFDRKKVIGIRLKKGRRWIEVGSGHFRPYGER